MQLVPYNLQTGKWRVICDHCQGWSVDDKSLVAARDKAMKFGHVIIWVHKSGPSAVPSNHFERIYCEPCAKKLRVCDI